MEGIRRFRKKSTRSGMAGQGEGRTLLARGILHSLRHDEFGTSAPTLLTRRERPAQERPGPPVAVGWLLSMTTGKRRWLSRAQTNGAEAVESRPRTEGD